MKIANPFEILYATAQKVWASLVPNTTTTRKYLSMTGDGVNGAAPAWRQLDVSDVWRQVNNGNTTGAKTLDFSTGNCQSLVLTGPVTLTFINPVFGATYRILVGQDATGGRAVTWPATVKWGTPGAPVLSGASKFDVIDMQYDGANYLSKVFGQGF